jgi:threonine dehydrogenase-like Zn-dependent dehydrogenase
MRGAVFLGNRPQAALGLGDLRDPFIGGHEPCGVVAARGPTS